MASFNITEAKTRFSELVQRAMLGEEVIISRYNEPVVKLVPMNKPAQPRKPGSGKGQVLYVAPDFDTTPGSFKGYM